MAQVHLIHDTRTVRVDGTSPIKISLCHNRQTVNISVNIYVLPDHWDGKTQKVINHQLSAHINNSIATKVLACEKKILQLMDSGEISEMTAKDIKAAIEGKADKKKPSNNFLQHFHYVASTKGKSTQSMYETTLKHIQNFEPNLAKLTFDQITKDWLTRLDLNMAKTAPSLNTRNIHLRNIRTVVNSAIDNELTTTYAFRKFKIKPAPVVKRSVHVETLREFMTAPCEDYVEYYRDMFMLSFLLIGINMVDLVYLKEIKDGRVDYIRHKTKKAYSIKVEPEALAIIDKYRGKEYLLDIADRYTDHRNFIHRINENVQKVGAPLSRVGRGGKKVYSHKPFSFMTTYWARHTWATIAASLDVSMETISAALGHDIGNPTTAIYINFYQEKVDEANRKVIDWVYYGKKDNKKEGV